MKTSYEQFLRAERTMQRAIGRYIVEMTEQGHDLAWFTQPTGIAVQHDHYPTSLAAQYAIIKGSDDDMASAVFLCGVSRKRTCAALAVLFAK